MVICKPTAIAEKSEYQPGFNFKNMPELSQFGKACKFSSELQVSELLLIAFYDNIYHILWRAIQY